MYGADPRVQPLYPGTYLSIYSKRLNILFYESYMPQEILRANENVNIAADLVTKYRKNVQYNLEAMRELEEPDEQ